MFRNVCTAFLFFCCSISCLDPYVVDIDGYDNLLVVDALITTENKSHSVYLSRSTTSIDSVSVKESGAFVSILESSGSEHQLKEVKAGHYQTDSSVFIVKVGHVYTLKIQTFDGVEYLSEPCEVLPKSQFDSLYFQKAEQWDTNGQYLEKGIEFIANGRSEATSYLRWIFEEDWKIRIPYPELGIYDDNDSLIYNKSTKIECWRHEISNNTKVYSFDDQGQRQYDGQIINFVPSGWSDRFSIKYALLVKQLSISKNEYEFWNKLTEATEDVGGAFGKQPFAISSNVVRVDDEKEPVLGYFQVGSVVSKRIFVDRDAIYSLELNTDNYYEGCLLDTVLIDGIIYQNDYEIYRNNVIFGKYRLHRPLYNIDGSIAGLMLTMPSCADCTLSGTNIMPDFWEE